MKKVYVIPDIHCEYEKFKNFFIKLDENDVIYQLGDFSFSSNHLLSITMYILFWNIQQQNNDKENKLPTLKIVRGNHEFDNYFFNPEHFLNKKQFNKAINYCKENYQEIFNDKYIPTGKDIIEWTEKLPLYLEHENYFLTHGWYNPNWDFNTHYQKDLYDFDENFDHIKKNGFCWGSPAKIVLRYKKWCAKHNLDSEDKNNIEKYKENGKKLHYYGFYSLEQYNEALKEKGKILIVGHWFNPLFNKSLEKVELSNLIMLDGGLGYANTNIYDFNFSKKDEKLNVKEISEIKKL